MQPRELAASFLKFVKMMITSFFSLDVALLFTNVLLKKTVNIILIKRIYNENQIPASLSKHSLKKIILDTCKKRLCYEQLDGVSMGGLANM